MIKISKNFTLEELTNSYTAKQKKITNKPSEEVIVNLCALVHHVLQPLRDYAKVPVRISSGYRCPALNDIVGGVSNSQHILGQAADITFDSPSQGVDWFYWIMENTYFDQLIWEGTWIHVSFNVGGMNRGQVIRRPKSSTSSKQ